MKEGSGNKKGTQKGKEDGSRNDDDNSDSGMNNDEFTKMTGAIQQLAAKAGSLFETSVSGRFQNPTGNIFYTILLLGAPKKSFPMKDVPMEQGALRR